MRAALALLALLLLSPVSLAQAPEPAEVVDQACGLVGGAAPDARDALPVCPREDPAGAPPQADGQDHAAAPEPTAAAPEQAQALVERAVEDAREIPQDPAGAPDRLAALVAALAQLAKDLLALPVDGAKAAGGALEAARDAMGDAASAAFDATREGATGALDAARAAGASAVDRVKALLAGLAPDAPRAPAREALPQARGAAQGAGGLVRDVTSLLG